MSEPEDDTPPVTLTDLVRVLGASIGDDVAHTALVEGAEELGLSTHHMSRTQALALLDHLAGVPGIVGVSSRFGRSRLMLKWASDQLRAGRR